MSFKQECPALFGERYMFCRKPALMNLIYEKKLKNY